MAGRSPAPNRDLLERLAADFLDDPGVAAGTMFRGPGLWVGGKVFAFLGHDGRLIVKLPGDRAGALVAGGTAEPVVLGKRTMREWVGFPAREDSTETLALWRGVAREAYGYVGASGGQGAE
jgi:hypothetical protein